MGGVALSCANIKSMNWKYCQVLRQVAGVALLCSVAVDHVSAQEGGSEVFAGETLFDGGLRVSLTEIERSKRHRFSGSSKTPGTSGDSFDEHRSVLGFDYGMYRDVTLTALVPYVDRTLVSPGNESAASGLGDVALIGKYRLTHTEGHAMGFNWSLIGGAELPTGATDAMDINKQRLDPSVQVGKGSLNPFVATSVTYGYQFSRFDATAFYKVNTEGAQKYEDGDFFSVSVSGAYRFLHYQYPGPTFGLRLGLKYRHQGRASSDGAAVENSGADEVIFSPALSIHPIPRMDMILGVRVPVYQHYQGTQIGRDLGLIFAIGMRF